MLQYKCILQYEYEERYILLSLLVCTVNSLIFAGINVYVFSGKTMFAGINICG